MLDVNKELKLLKEAKDMFTPKFNKLELELSAAGEDYYKSEKGQEEIELLNNFILLSREIGYILEKYPIKEEEIESKEV